MKKRLIWYFVIIFITLTSFVNAISPTSNFYNVTYNCKDDICIEGKMASWDVTVQNMGEKEIEIIQIQLKDAFDDSVFAMFNVSYTPHTDDPDIFFTVPSTKSMTKTIEGRIPSSNSNGDLLYYVCYTTAVMEQIYAKENIYSLEYCYKDRPAVMPVVQCVHSYDCSYDEYCQDNYCKKLNCSECEFTSYHNCVPYKCCSSTDCNTNAQCINYGCVDLDCQEDEYLFNHTCLKLNCTSRQQLFNHSCVSFSCKEDEEYFNHTCKKLDCANDEYILNNTCKKLDCANDEGFVNHSCLKINCTIGQAIKDHQCQALNCEFYEQLYYNECIINYPLVFKLSLEVTVIIIIISLLFIDIKKYKKGKKK